MCVGEKRLRVGAFDGTKCVCMWTKPAITSNVSKKL